MYNANNIQLNFIFLCNINNIETNPFTIIATRSSQRLYYVIGTTYILLIISFKSLTKNKITI